MAKLWTRCNSTFVSKDKLIRDILEAHTRNNGIFTLISIVFCAFTLALAQTPALIPGLSSMYPNLNLQKATKLVLELFVKSQEYKQLRASTGSCNCSFKALNRNLYYKSLNIECYYFC